MFWGLLRTLREVLGSIHFLHPGPGLTLVVGRNGSGKSSFAEALEVLLTGDNKRWSARSAVWREGWRNLHHDACAVAAEFILEGEKARPMPSAPGQTAMPSPTLAPPCSVPAARRRPRRPRVDRPLDSHRPYLSYNELGSMLDQGPTKLYEAIASILGLDYLADAEKRIKDAIGGPNA